MLKLEDLKESITNLKPMSILKYQTNKGEDAYFVLDHVDVEEGRAYGYILHPKENLRDVHLTTLCNQFPFEVSVSEFKHLVE